MRFVTWAKVRIIGLVAAVYIVAFIGTTPGSSRAATTTPTATLGTTPSATPLPKPSGFPARAITLPDEKSGAITLPGSTDRYIFYAEFNQIVSIGVFTSDAGFGPTLDLAAPDATVLATATGADSALIAGAQLPVSGAYIVTVRPAKTGQVGRYALRVSKGATLRDLDGDALRVGAVVRGQIEQIGDRQTWSFDARGGTNFWVLARPARGSSLDPVIEIVNPTGETIASAHDLSKTNSAGTADPGARQRRVRHVPLHSRPRVKDGFGMAGEIQEHCRALAEPARAAPWARFSIPPLPRSMGCCSTA